MSKSLLILGSTGSIGRQTLEVVDWFPEEYQVVGLAAGSDIDLLAKQAEKYAPRAIAIADETMYPALKARLPHFKGEILAGRLGVKALAAMEKADTVLAAISGVAGLEPVVAAMQAGKNIALANKETLVAAGQFIKKLAIEKQVALLPVDSEHSAIWQCLQQAEQKAEKLILTASGGPFLNYSIEQLQKVQAEDALRHPTWHMGPKITIDSATLMNKGLEIIEAHWLFDMAYDDIEVVIHPQSIIHSMVGYPDGAILAQLGVPDMRVPIQFALSYPKRLKNAVSRVNFAQIGQLSFQEPDYEGFPCLKLAIAAGRAGGTYPAVLNAANEELVHRFIAGRVGFPAIAEGVEAALACHRSLSDPSFADILAADLWARDFIQGLK